MLRPRLVVCLLVRNGGLVKTIRFGESKYVGDPINAVRIFNEKEVDELVVADIDATRLGREPNIGLIAALAAECRMPLCYAGGITHVEQVERIVDLGVEKVAIGAAAIESPDVIPSAAARVGSQSVVGVVDVKRTGILRKREVVVRNAQVETGVNPAHFAATLEAAGAGEILLNSVDRDGTMEGYDSDLVAEVRSATSVPLTVLGGAGSLDDAARLFADHGVIGAAAGSLFVFKGRYRAVLISYPDANAKSALFESALQTKIAS